MTNAAAVPGQPRDKQTTITARSATWSSPKRVTCGEALLHMAYECQHSASLPRNRGYRLMKPDERSAPCDAAHCSTDICCNLAASVALTDRSSACASSATVPSPCLRNQASSSASLKS